MRVERRLQEGCRNAELVPAIATKLASVSNVPGFLRFSIFPPNLCVVSTVRRAHGEDASRLEYVRFVLAIFHVEDLH